MATWTNADGQKFDLKILPPFLEDELNNTIEFPAPPCYVVKQLDADGREVDRIYPHTDETMTELAEEDTPTKERVPWPINNQPAKWSPEATNAERRAWRGYKAAHAKATLASTELIMKRIISDGIDVTIPEEYLGGRPETEELRFKYITNHILASEADLMGVYLAIQSNRKINPERLALLQASFQNNEKRDSAKETS